MSSKSTINHILNRFVRRNSDILSRRVQNIIRGFELLEVDGVDFINTSSSNIKCTPFFCLK